MSAFWLLEFSFLIKKKIIEEQVEISTEVSVHGGPQKHPPSHVTGHQKV